MPLLSCVLFSLRPGPWPERTLAAPIPYVLGLHLQFRCNINMVEHGTKVGALPVGSVDESDQKSYILDPLDKEELEVLDKVTNETVDFRGRPAIRSKSGNWKACFLIFGTEVCERMAFYSISANLSMHLQEALHEDVSVSARNVNNWVGTTFLTPLLGAFVADSFAGRYWTIASFSCGYFVALALVVMSVTLPTLKPQSCDVLYDEKCANPTSLQVGFFYMSLYLMALGAGGIKSCVAGFAGDQFDDGDKKEAKRKMSFMNWWFVSISFGTMCSVSFLVYIQIAVGLEYGWGIPALISAFTTTAFLLGTPLYRHRKPTGSPFARVAQVIVAAARKYSVQLPHDDDLLYEIDDKEALDPANRKLPHTQDFTFLDKAAVPGAEVMIYNCKGARPDPWKLCTVTQVEEVKLLIRLLPIWITNLMFSAVFAQVGTLFLNQGSTMNRKIETIGFQIPAASFPLFVTFTICSLLPLYDKFFVPFMRRFTGEERGISLLQRIGVGQVVSTLSITVAACVEMKRMAVAKRYIFENGIIMDHSKGSGATLDLPMSIFWLTPQYMLTGASEVFISVGQMEFFYSQVPDSMRSVGAALYLSTVAVGSFVSSLLVTVVTKLTMNSNGGWIGNDLTRSHIDYFYWLLATLSLLNFSIYIACARWYKYKTIPGRSTSTFTSPEVISPDVTFHPIKPLLHPPPPPTTTTTHHGNDSAQIKQLPDPPAHRNGHHNGNEQM
ncbi:solute carrier family 15 (peptide/histidine transporter), member 3/4 [Marchantia polymorpha subsp. ruderalis]|uniref:Uncharacterized protein n=3 Tax=Marchantia polymorpha TaxID=3197 RepID=A0AAF6AZ39_MARPO|nr:hypothetical protein MARPO_0085s0065 [Marchantia polymorpha]BBN05023.1 hypothetical protein Mp_3g09620 [Marchantia polymorpha subsp. ruderalis]|eukprot:PTQ33853.1 hypothetical protein MARPO_0085s0065 [Marchantia polymorpha]